MEFAPPRLGYTAHRLSLRGSAEAPRRTSKWTDTTSLLRHSGAGASRNPRSASFQSHFKHPAL